MKCDSNSLTETIKDLAEVLSRKTQLHLTKQSPFASADCSTGTHSASISHRGSIGDDIAKALCTKTDPFGVLFSNNRNGQPAAPIDINQTKKSEADLTTDLPPKKPKKREKLVFSKLNLIILVGTL